MPRLRLRRAAGSAVLVAVFPFLLLAPGWLRARPVHAEPPPAGAVPYRPPVDGPVVEPFHVEHPFGPGNRGIDYAVAPCTPVRAAADGEVIFAGPVAGTLHVTIRHADGLRTSYSFLASVDVRAGQTVRAGDVVGRSVEVVHFGVRDPTGTYLDPATLFSAGRRRPPGARRRRRDPAGRSRRAAGARRARGRAAGAARRPPGAARRPGGPTAAATASSTAPGCGPTPWPR